MLAGLLEGQLLDFGRLPVLTVLCAAGLAVGLLRRELWPWLAVVAVALLVACGPMSFASLPGLGLLQLHRAIAVLHLALVGLVGLGAAQLTQALVAPVRSRRLALATALVAVVVLGALARDRRGLMAAAELGATELADLRDLHQVIARVRAILEEQPGRVYAGAANGWGESFRAAGVPVYAHLEAAGVDTLGFLFHALGVASDAAPEFDENSPVEQEVFGVAVMVLPAARAAPAGLVLDRRIGRFAIYRNPRAGLFRIAAIEEGVTAPPGELYPVVAQLRRGPAGLSRTLIASMHRDAPGSRDGSRRTQTSSRPRPGPLRPDRPLRLARSSRRAPRGITSRPPSGSSSRAGWSWR